MKYTRRQYRVEGPELDKRRIMVTVEVGGTVLAKFQAREPGLMAIVSKPDDQGIMFELLDPGFVFVDQSLPDGMQTLPPAAWQLAALEE